MGLQYPPQQTGLGSESDTHLSCNATQVLHFAVPIGKPGTQAAAVGV